MRLFIGIELDDAVVRRAAKVAGRLKDRLASVAPRFQARWIDQSNLHITLWFLGEVHGPRADSVIESLNAGFDLAAFSLTVRGCGAFPPSGAPRVLWIGVTQGLDAMRALYGLIEERLTPMGFEGERRPYTPHLTIARVKDPGPRPFRSLREAIADVPADCGESAVTAVTLFRSRLSPRGATYEPLLRVPLS